MQSGQCAASDRLFALCCSTRCRVRLTIAVVWCIMAASCGLIWWAFHFALLLRHPPWGYLFLAAVPPALVSAGVVWLFLAAWNDRHAAIAQRQADLHQNLINVIHLNERVRNALQAIAYASHARSEQELLQVLHESVNSIEQELRAITPVEALHLAPHWVPKKPVGSAGTANAHAAARTNADVSRRAQCPRPEPWD